MHRYTVRNHCQLVMMKTTTPQIQVGTLGSTHAKKSFPQFVQKLCPSRFWS
jgi:hypothetical protein